MLELSNWRKSGNIRDLTNYKFGKLTALYPCARDERQRLIWLCRCECGETKQVKSSVLVSSHVKSCGCLRKSDMKEMAQRHLFQKYEYSSVTRGYKFDLSLTEFVGLIARNCHYCGSESTNTMVSKSGKRSYILKYNGVDRCDSSRGYEPGNVVPCCKHCNEMKMSRSLEEFLGHIKKISDFQSSQ